jgi:hypothetical protein
MIVPGHESAERAFVVSPVSPGDDSCARGRTSTVATLAGVEVRANAWGASHSQRELSSDSGSWDSFELSVVTGEDGRATLTVCRLGSRSTSR